MIDRDDIDRLKEIFVTRLECENTMDAINEKISGEDVRLAVIEHRLGTITWLLMAVGGGIITMLIKMFFGA